jgi:MFS family permease
VPATSEFYGVLPQQLADVLHLLTTGSTTPLSPDDPDTYLYQGAANLILGILAVTALAIAIALAFESLLAGAFLWSLTLSLPLWLGMQHVDFKDIPVAAGLTLVTAGLVLGFVLTPGRGAVLTATLLAGFGGAIAVGSRPSSIVLLTGLVGGTLVVAVAWGALRHRLRDMLPIAFAAVAAPVCGLVLTWGTNPIARIGSFTWLHDSIDIARHYPGYVGTIRTAGQDLRSTNLPWWYVPAWLWAQAPLLTLVAVLGGMAVVVVRLTWPRRPVVALEALTLVPLAIQAIVLPVIIVASGAVLYDGIPALLAFAAVALAWLDRDAGPRGRVAVPVTAVVVVAASLAASIRWAPYAYAFVNPIAGRNKEHRAWELDYWGVSAREGVQRLRAAGYSPVFVAPSQQPGVPFGAYNSKPETGGNSALYVFIRWDRASRGGCEVIFTIKRDGNLLGEGARCPN